MDTVFDKADFDGQGKTYEEETIGAMRMLVLVMAVNAAAIAGVGALIFSALN